MTSPNIEISCAIHDDAWHQNLTNCEAFFKKIVQLVCDELEIGTQCEDLELSVLLTNDEEIQTLNAQYRNKDKPTNVLSFPQEQLTPKRKLPKHLVLGDIVLASDIIHAEAKESNITFEAHLTHLAMHGVLHLLGYNHEDDAEAEIMEQQEIALLAKLGISNPY